MIRADNLVEEFEKNSVIFVYYKIDPILHSSTGIRVKKLQLELYEVYPDLNIEIMQRPEISSQGLETWMEIYRYPGGVTNALFKHIEVCALRNGLPGIRKVERFLPLKN